MDSPITAADLAPTSDPHQELRVRLCARYGLGGEFVDAPTIARIMGLGRTTVHDQVKAGRFAIPHRLAARKPLFRLDDLVAWMLGRDWPQATGTPTPAEQTTPSTNDAPQTFLHRDAEAAFLRVCEKRGIAPTISRAKPRRVDGRPSAQ